MKLVALAIFVALALPAFSADNFEPFAPFGYGSMEIADGTKQGVMAAAAIIFFAFYGFDAVSTAAEETKNPKRDLKIGIIGSMVLCTFLYMVVAAAALGGSRYQDLADSAEPLAMVLRNLQHPFAATLIAMAAVIALPTVIMAFMYGQSRIFFVMARDGLLPQRLSVVASALRHAGADDVHHQHHRRDDRCVRAAAEHRSRRQRGHADRVHRRRRVHDGDAQDSPAASAHVRSDGDVDHRHRGRASAASTCSRACRRRTMYSVLIWNVVGLAIYLLWARRKSLLEPAAR